jgi:hypothetical protein
MSTGPPNFGTFRGKSDLFSTTTSIGLRLVALVADGKSDANGICNAKMGETTT